MTGEQVQSIRLTIKGHQVCNVSHVRGDAQRVADFQIGLSVWGTDGLDIPRGLVFVPGLFSWEETQKQKHLPIERCGLDVTESAGFAAAEKEDVRLRRTTADAISLGIFPHRRGRQICLLTATLWLFSSLMISPT